ncbi:hypothetical protein D9599_22155 [Roseomonas sp. KE2513]|uniref:hypothetical protein n=1 Tax=Roseomonas sp. KE2513 TaxID=2479202 RepID=UPI0018DFD8EE|nr:hypothetical protein [Roseomonas sp. KE2513]MBI0538272.1 hypothetical protein [Roseomonas sp. KE2513]
MTIFDEKLATLSMTVRLGADGPFDEVNAALLAGAGRPAIAVGSGGSAIAAEFFARCRSTLGYGTTIVQTPMDLVVSQDDLSGFDIWLFSAGANNPDIAGAFTAALGSAAAAVRLLTVNPQGETSLAAGGSDRVQVIVAPVADRKDGFLATHSLVAMVTCLLAACEVITRRSGRDVVDRYAAEVAATVAPEGSPLSNFRSGDTVVVLHDPQCRTLATLIETSLWETGIAPVQRADFRNFAHGRHVWAARHPESTFVIAVTAAMSRDIWQAIRLALPSSIRSTDIDLGHATRFRTAISVVEGLTTVQSLGKATGTDPGKPGRGKFAEAIYGDPGLARLADSLDPAIRHKLEAVHLYDDPSCPTTSAGLARDQWLSAISGARIGGVVLDYDGTVVTTVARLDPPDDQIIAELTRLADSGIAIGFATGRGGSAGEALRKTLPERLHPLVTVGYYNGGHIRPLSVDIENDQPDPNPDIASTAMWIEDQCLLRPGVRLKRSRVQITINHSDVLAPATFNASLTTLPAVADGRVRAVSSHHSFDLLPTATSKTAVIAHMRVTMSDDARVLSIGDSGEPGGNDTELLASPPSVSVDSVCGHLQGSWSLFGRTPSGPAALLRILRALRLENGHGRLDLNSLGKRPA